MVKKSDQYHDYLPNDSDLKVQFCHKFGMFFVTLHIYIYVKSPINKMMVGLSFNVFDKWLHIYVSLIVLKFQHGKTHIC